MSTRAGLRQRARALSDDEFARIVWLPLLTAFEGERVRAELVVTLAQPGDTICRLGRPVTYFFPGVPRAPWRAPCRATTSNLRQHGTTLPWQDRMLDFQGMNSLIGTQETLAQARRYE